MTSENDLTPCGRQENGQPLDGSPLADRCSRPAGGEEAFFQEVAQLVAEGVVVEPDGRR
jgi:hypothetical protein